MAMAGMSRERGPARSVLFRRWETLQDIVRLQVRHFSQHLPFGCRCQSRGRTLSGCSRRRPGVWPPLDSTRGQWSQRSGVGPSRNPRLPTPVGSKDQRFGKVFLACWGPPSHLKRTLIGDDEMTGRGEDDFQPLPLHTFPARSLLACTFFSRKKSSRAQSPAHGSRAIHYCPSGLHDLFRLIQPAN